MDLLLIGFVIVVLGPILLVVFRMLLMRVLAWLAMAPTVRAIEGALPLAEKALAALGRSAGEMAAAHRNLPPARKQQMIAMLMQAPNQTIC